MDLNSGSLCSEIFAVTTTPLLQPNSMLLQIGGNTPQGCHAIPWSNTARTHKNAELIFTSTLHYRILNCIP